MKDWTSWVQGLLWSAENAMSPGYVKQLWGFMNSVSIFPHSWPCPLLLSFVFVVPSLSEKKSKSFFQHMSKTHCTVIGVATGVVFLLLIISVFIQMKQPRKKVNIHIEKSPFRMTNYQPECQKCTLKLYIFSTWKMFLKMFYSSASYIHKPFVAWFPWKKVNTVALSKHY